MKDQASNPLPQRTAATCPFGCGRPLPSINGRRRIVCDKCRHEIPADVWAAFTSTTSDTEARRAAIRQILAQAAKAKAERQRNSGEQLNLL